MRGKRIRWSWWLRVEAVVRSRQPAHRRDVGAPEQRTTIKMGLKTIQLTSTRVGNESRRNAGVEPMPTRGIGHLWGSGAEFSPDGICGA